MSAPPNFIDDLANGFIAAEEKHAPIEPVAARYPKITFAEAYQVQTAVIKRLAQRGDRLIGKKVAATNQAAQQALGLAGPGYGHLFESYRVVNHGQISLSQLIQPVVECEVAFLLKQNLAGPGITADDVLAATGSVVASLEIIDFRTRDWKPGAYEAIAYNGFAAHFVLGSEPAPPAGLDLASISAALKKNDEEPVVATGAAVLGNPANSVAWLANKVAEHGSQLAASEIILSGAITALKPTSAGDRFEATVQGLGSVSVHFV